MTGFEATNSIQPQKNIRHYKLTIKKSKGYIPLPDSKPTWSTRQTLMVNSFRKIPPKSTFIEKNYIWAVAIMFILVGFLCTNNYIILRSYEEMKNELSEAYKVISAEKQAKQKSVSEDIELQKSYQQLTQELSQLKDNYSKTSRGSDDLSKQLDALKKQNSELSKQYGDLSKQNKDLVNDNVALQNSLKMAASAGVKPQSFSIFEGLQPRSTINRGKFIGKFLGTAYTPSKEECGNNKGITKSGTPVMPGVSIAIDNHYWPFGTVFYIKGLGYTVAMDTGSAIKGKYRFDFSVFDKNFAKQLGSRKWEVYLVKLGTGSAKNVKL